MILELLTLSECESPGCVTVLMLESMCVILALFVVMRDYFCSEQNILYCLYICDMLFKSGSITYYDDFSGCYLLYLLYLDILTIFLLKDLLK